jgi:hypothetical protein
MAKPLGIAWSEISFGQIAMLEWNRHNSINQSQLGVNKDFMERQIHVPRIEKIVCYMVWSVNRGKFVEEVVVMKCNEEEADDDARRQLGNPLIEHEWLCQAWRVNQSCMDTFKLCMKEHGHIQSMDNEKVRKKLELFDFKWSDLPEVITRFLFIYNMTVYIVLFNQTIK